MRRLREQKKWVFLALFAMIILTGSTFTQSNARQPIQAANRGHSPIWAERTAEEEGALVEDASVETAVQAENEVKVNGRGLADKPVPPGQQKKVEVPVTEESEEVPPVAEEPDEPEVVEDPPAPPAEDNPGHQNGQQENQEQDEQDGEEPTVDDGEEPVTEPEEADEDASSSENEGPGNQHGQQEDEEDVIPDETEEAPIVTEDGHGNGGPVQGETPGEAVEELPGISSDSSLFTILIDGERIPGFHPDKKDYTYVFDADIQVLPPIYAVPMHEEATVKYSKVTQLPETMVIQVRAEDGSETHYHLHLTAAGLKEGEVILLLESIPEAPADGIMGLWLPPTEETFDLGKGSAAIRFWVAEPLLAPEIWIYDPAGSTSDAVIKITTGELKMNTGSGRHSRATVASGEGGFYKYNLKLKSHPSLAIGKTYTLAIMNGGDQVYFGENTPALLHFEVVDAFKEAPSNRNRTEDKSPGRSKAGGKR